MFLPVKAHKDFINKKEPSIRIGRKVPKDAVNMAYYFNPTATDAEKVLCADAPRNTIDHRVEEQYRYLFNQPEQNDNLFSIIMNYSDEEGYAGALSRIWVKWKERVHITEKNMQVTNTILVDNKEDVPKFHRYSDIENFDGNLFMEAVDYEVKNTKTETIQTTLYKNVDNYEIYQMSVSSAQLDYYMQNPNTNPSSPWPKELYVRNTLIEDSTGKVWGPNSFKGYTSPANMPLTLLSIEKDPIASNADQQGIPSYTMEYGEVILQTKKTIMTTMPFYATYTGEPGINSFISLMNAYTVKGINSEMWNRLMTWKNETAAQRAKYSIQVIRGDSEIYKITADGPDKGKFFYMAGYKLVYSYTSTDEIGTHNWNVYANYTGTLTKPYYEIKTYPVSWEATVLYTGIVRKLWSTFDGTAYYRGSAIKSDGVGNINPELNADLLMYPDDNGYLRRYDISGNNYYKIEAEQFYITDVFKDNTPCFFEYKLTNPIHDYRGPDDNGYYDGDAIKVYTANLKTLPEDYKYQLKLKPSEYETVTEVIDGISTATEKVKKYNAYLYSSFISTTTDNYKATYNAFIEYNDDIINTNNGINEEIYNRPYMIPNQDYYIVSVNPATRANRIRIAAPNIIEDTRHYVTFEYKVTAYKKELDGTGLTKVFESNARSTQILNKEYAVESEYNKFRNRGMIISPQVGNVYLSPFDIIIADQSLLTEVEPIVTLTNSSEFLFYCKPIEETLNPDLLGAININCNTDGSGVITAETTLDTGFWNESTGTYTKKLIINNPYIIEDGKIYPGYMIRCLDARNITIKAPREDKLLESWYPLIQFGHYSQVMDQYGTHTKISYTMPEYDEQHWGALGKPFVDVIEEKVEILNPHMIKVRNTPLHIPNINPNDNNVIVKRRTAEDGDIVLTVTAISFTEGVIITKEAISENDVIIVNYTYMEQYYVYRGFNRNELDFCRIDLNPNQYHTYSDLSTDTSTLQPTTNLFNRTIYFYLRPTIRYQIASANDDLIDTDVDLDKIMLQNKETLYHTIDVFEPESEMDIYIGSVYVRQNASLHSTILIDTRTRGGGVLEEMKDSLRKELEPESDFYLDIGCYDGTPYQENAVVIVRLDNSILKEYGGRFLQGDIEEKVTKWLGLGVYPIIEYVDSYSKFDMPQYNLIVEDSYINVLDETLEINLECISI